jgi:hypothetical protein
VVVARLRCCHFFYPTFASNRIVASCSRPGLFCGKVSHQVRLRRLRPVLSLAFRDREADLLKVSLFRAAAA